MKICKDQNFKLDRTLNPKQHHKKNIDIGAKLNQLGMVPQCYDEVNQHLLKKWKRQRSYKRCKFTQVTKWDCTI